MNLFSNRLMKRTVFNLIIAFILVLLIGGLSSFVFTSITIKELIKYDMALVGALYENKDVSQLSILTGEINKMDYEKGKAILSEYSYGTSLSSSFSHYKVVYIGNMSIILIGLLVFFLISVLIVSHSLSKVFTEIKTISSKMQVGNLTDINEFSDMDDSEVAVLKSTINSLSKRSGYQVEALNRDKQLLQKMLTDISHQLKTPLSAIRMYNEIMINKSDIDNVTRSEFLNESQEQIDRIDWLIQGLLKMARIEADAIEMIKKPYYLADTIETSVAPFYAFAKTNDISLIVETNSEILLEHDSQWVAEAFGNIIKNAIEHTKSGGFVKITAEETPLTVEVKIQDNGEGIRKSDIAHIFKRFYHVKSRKKGSAGIGLGLAKEILERNGADIYVNSEFGVGSEFIITFLKKT